MNQKNAKLMDIYYNRSASLFSEPISKALDDVGNDLTKPLRIRLGAGGYDCDAILVIGHDESAFKTDWTGPDKSRFPARVKAAATVLWQRSLYGRYRVKHNRKEGLLVIQCESG